MVAEGETEKNKVSVIY